MDTLKINLGNVSLKIVDENNNEKGIFTFNPNDINTANKFFDLLAELDIKKEEFTKREAELAEDDVKGKLALTLEVIDYFENKIDNIFGAGSSELIFGQTKSIDMFKDFFEGLMPYYQKASQNRIDKYTEKYN